MKSSKYTTGDASELFAHGKLSLVATPIGNMKDITLRALETLRDCDYVVCEDTRTTHNLLEYHKIKDNDISKSKDDVQKNKTLLIFHANSSDREIEKIIDLLEQSKHICYVSDAGTPTLSDPGVLLVNKVRELLPDCIIESLPGACAAIVAYSLSGAIGNSFTFYGFMPHKKGRETMIKNILENEMTSIVYESVHRIEKLLESFKKNESMFLEDGTLENKREYIVCREITKLYEEVVIGDIDKVSDYFKNNQDKVRGEFVVVVK